MNNRRFKVIIKAGLAGLLIMVSGCSLFPDKEQQYQQHSELDPLQLPADLQENPERQQAADLQGQQQKNKDDESNTQSAVTESDQIPMLVDISKEPIHILIFEDYQQALHTVGKTLTHMGLEVLDRDEAKGQFVVVYEKAAKPVDDSLWSFLAFWRDDGQHEEYDFRVKLFDDVDATKILILDAADQPVNEGPGRALLQQIYQALWRWNN